MRSAPPLPRSPPASRLSAVEVSDRELAFALEGPAVLEPARRRLSARPRCDAGRARHPHGFRQRAGRYLIREATDRVRLEVWRSFAPHVRALLDTAARELAAGLREPSA